MPNAETGGLTARVLRAAGHHATILVDSNEIETLITQPLLAGDRVQWDPIGLRISGVLPRHGVISRKRPGRASEEQPLAANVDAALIVQGLDGDYNPRRLERYLVLAAASGVRAAIVLNKADLLMRADAESLAAQVRRRTGTPVVLISARSGEGVEQLDELMRPAEIAVLLGSSGAGKSTLTNALLGREEQAVRTVRESDSRGRHTTTSRELFLLPAGWYLLDSPGLREVEAWDAGEALDEAFDDIGELAQRCRFRDCRHQGEPGCAVREAEAEGSIDPDRVEHYRKLTKETSAQEIRRNARIGSRAIRQYNKMRHRP